MIEVDGGTLQVFLGGERGPLICSTIHWQVQKAAGTGWSDVLADVGRLVWVNPR